MLLQFYITLLWEQDLFESSMADLLNFPPTVKFASVSWAFEMFCSGCGTASIPNAIFCHSCGEQLSGIPGSSPATSNMNCGQNVVTANSESRNVSLESFCARKDAKRSKFFKSSRKPQTKNSKIEEQDSEVKINLGIMAMKDVKLSIKRGATLPLTVAPSITAVT